MSVDDRAKGDDKKRRSGSFGAVASTYERFRPGPPLEAIAWMLPPSARTVVDLGAGTGAMSKQLLGLVDRVIAIEPDNRMRAVLTENLHDVTALRGVGESMPIDDASVDAVLASSSWHWMKEDLALQEAARVLVPGGTLSVVWSGPDPDGPFLVQAQALLAQMSDAAPSSTGSDVDKDLGDTVLGTEERIDPVLRIPPDSLFAQPEHQILIWDVALTADDLIGLLGTFSWIITMEDDRRAHVVSEARRLLSDVLGISGDLTVDVQYRSEAWRTRLTRQPGEQAGI